MQVNNSEVDLTLAGIKERPAVDGGPDDRSLEDDIAISEAVNAAEEELQERRRQEEEGGVLPQVFLLGAAVAAAAIFFQQTNAFSFLK